MANNEKPRQRFPLKPRRNNKSNPLALVFFVIISVFFASFFLRPSTPTVQTIPYSTFTHFLDQKNILRVKIIDDRTIEGSLKDGTPLLFRTFIPYQDSTLLAKLMENDIAVEGGSANNPFWRILLELVPWIIGFGFIYYMMRSAPGSGKAFQFGKSKAKRYEDNGKKITFADVAGQKDAKYELEEVVAFLKDPERFTRMGAKIPKGVLLVGMPGTGKTLMARAVAGEANVAYFHMSGSDFVEMFVGVGASRVRDLFEQGRKSAPCIIFIDELDAVGRTRGAGYGGGHDEREQTLNQLLVEMDGFDANAKDSIIILAATNRPDVLDPALLRPGRFDRQVVVAMPDVKEREQIFRIHAKKVQLDNDIDFDRLARAAPGMSGAEIANLVNEAALFAARRQGNTVAMSDFEQARDKIVMGVARTSLAISEKERKMTAIHESGHALLHYHLENADPLHKVTIVPHGRALGMAMSLPESDSYSRTKGWIEDRIVICYGGWAAEMLLYKETTTGTKQDIQQATEMARHMVCEWGMDEDMGPVAYGQEDEPIFIGRDIARHKDYSEETAKNLDAAVKKILDKAKERAQSILSEYQTDLEKLADELMAKETLSNEDVRTLLNIK
ncbi:MAG: ATP-dependent zinc metalloprotease FtsH [Treponema sp.]|nr:ATP-dependent zinc metalloprotease FtsH [Treponema sp.]